MRTASRIAAVVAALAMPTALVTLGPMAPALGADGDATINHAIELAHARPGTTRLGSGQSLRAVRGLVDRDGTTHVRFERFFKGLPVIGGDMVVHQSRGGAWKGASLTLDRNINVPTRARVSKAAAGRAALRAQAGQRISGGEVADSALVVEASGTPRLAWQVVTGGLQADRTPSRIETYVDAETGAVIRSEQRIWTVDGGGSGQWSGSVNLDVTKSGNTYELKDPSRGGTYTVTMDNKKDSLLCTLLGGILNFLCPKETLITSSTNVFSDKAAVDAQYGTAMTWDYFKNTFGRNGIFGNGTGSYNRVHYDKNYVNAFWDGKRMTYGDGDGTNYGPLTSLDVAAHEMSHGVTEKTANLTYSGESGGLNEATSDIFGTMVEFYANNPKDRPDYLIGEQFDLKNHTGFRRLDKPSTDGKSADCWNSKVKNLDVHYSSGVGNHFFYLLAEGSGAKTINGVNYNSPTCNGSTVAGIGRDKAAAIWFRALTVHMTSNTNYAGARTATLKAASELYGASSAENAAVAKAWSAVSVG